MKLDEFQEKARNNMDSRVLLVAPPGSGKTTVLLAKIEYLKIDNDIQEQIDEIESPVICKDLSTLRMFKMQWNEVLL